MRILFLYQIENLKICIQGIEMVQSWLKKATDEKINLVADYVRTDFDYSVKTSKINVQNYGMVENHIIEPREIGGQGLLTSLKKNQHYDIICLLFNPNKYNPRPKYPVAVPIYYNDASVIQINVFDAYEDYAFSITFAHELFHAIYFLINYRGNLKLKDEVHDHSTYDDPRADKSYLNILKKIEPYWQNLTMPNYKIADRDITKLVDPLQKLAFQLLDKAKFGEWEAFITEGFRSFKRQEYLYSIGRRGITGENIVTHAKAGTSKHEIGEAFDIGFVNWKGQISWNESLFDQAGHIGRNLGLVWGGDWKLFKDRPHFELKNNYKFMNEQIKIIKDKNSTAVGFWIPATSEQALDSMGHVFGKEIIRKSGQIDWNKIIEGELTLK